MAGEHRPGATEGQQGKGARVDPEARDDPADTAVHARYRDIDDCLGGAQHIAAQRYRQWLDGRAGGCHIHRDRVVAQLGLAQHTQCGKRISDGRLRAATAVTHRARR